MSRPRRPTTRRARAACTIAPLALLAALGVACGAPEQCRPAPATIGALEPAQAPNPDDPADLLARRAGPNPANSELRILPAMPDVNRYLAGGWSSAERWQDQSDRGVWRWSIGPMSRVRFSLDRVEPLLLSLTALPFQPPGGRPQHVRVWVNDHYLASLRLEPQSHVYELTLPALALRAGENTVRFHYLWTEQPANVLPNNPDRRDLAMAVSEIVIKPVGEARRDDASLVSVQADGRPAPARGLLPPASGRSAMLVWPPAGSSLELGWIRLGEGGDAPVSYRVEAEWDRGRQVLLEGVASQPDHVETARVALPAEADGAVRILLSVDDADAKEGEPPRLVWLEPRIVPPPGDGTIRGALSPLRAPSETNLVIFVLDAAARDRLGVYGSKANTTPHIDLIARESLVFDAAYAQASYTLASTASLFTSRLPSEHGVLEERDRLGPEWPTLAEALARSGYATAAFSANPYVSPVLRMTRGFERVDELFRGRAEGQAALASEFVAPVRAWFEEQGQKPFFAYIHLIQPHEPYNIAPPDFYRGRLVPDYAGSFDGSQEQMRAMFRGALHPGTSDVAQIRGLYEGNLAYADAVVGQIVQSLGELGLWGRTMVVITSDHGESLGERGVWGHGNSVDREQIALPLVVRFPPGMISPHRRDDLVASIDLMPSVLQVLGAYEPAGMRGRSWFARPEPHAWPRPLVSIAEGRSGTVSVLVPGLKYSYEQATGTERLLPLPAEEDGENLRWDRPVTFAWLAEEAVRLTTPRAREAAPAAEPEPAPELPADVKEALKALGYAE
jgi:arylsulfatase A-like enzyme